MSMHMVCMRVWGIKLMQRKMSYTRGGDGNSEIYVMNADGSKILQG
jgi:hypothetical protein